MTLVELALARPEQEREAFLQSVCGTNPELLDQALSYIRWEKRMDGFLLEPLYAAPEDDHPFQPNQVLIGRFRIIREIAQGGMGVVYEAIDEKLDRRVAIKCAKGGFRKQLPPEVRNAREISHPNVCKIFEIHTASAEHGGIDFISMEFLKGETLAERLRRGALPKAESRTIALQLCAGLAEAHRNNVIHGDLKTNNVFLTKGPEGLLRAVIMDFGLARRPGGSGVHTSSSLLGGTPDYMAPELWRGTRATVASDIYALGVILWELGSGRSPSELPVTASTLSWEERLTWKPPAGRATWDRIVARCLDPDPEQRFHSAAEIAQTLDPHHSRKWLFGVAASVVLAVTSGVATYQRVMAPLETVRLAVLPFQADGGVSASVAEKVSSEAAEQIAKLKGNAYKRLAIVPFEKSLDNKAESPSQAGARLGATHVLHGTLEPGPNGVTLHVYLTDARYGVDAKKWDGEYRENELGYAGTAVAGVATETLRLPPLVAKAVVNERARKDYADGLASLRHDNTIEAALASMTRAVAEDPDSALPYAGLAEAEWFEYFDSDEQHWLEGAAQAVRQAEERNPDLVQVHQIVGLMKATAGLYGEATAEYLRAIELAPGDSDAYRRLGAAYEENREPDKAVAEFRKAIEIDPQESRNYSNLGRFYFQRAEYQEAVKQFQRAVELGFDEPMTHYDLGATYLELGRLMPAEMELRSSLRLQENRIALHALGVVLIYEGRDREAIPDLEGALRLGPKTYMLWMNLGTAYRLAGLASQSRRAYRRGLDLAEAEIAQNPSDGLVRAYMAYLCSQLGDRRRAKSEILQALKQSATDAKTRFAAAITYEALGNRDATLKLLADSPAGVVEDISRWPDVADLHRDSRFLQLLGSHPGN